MTWPKRRHPPERVIIPGGTTGEENYSFQLLIVEEVVEGPNAFSVWIRIQVRVIAVEKQNIRKQYRSGSNSNNRLLVTHTMSVSVQSNTQQLMSKHKFSLNIIPDMWVNKQSSFTAFSLCLMAHPHIMYEKNIFYSSPVALHTFCGHPPLVYEQISFSICMYTMPHL